MWPIPRAPISSTRNLVSSVALRAVSGSPISLLSEPGVHTVGALCWSTWAMRSLVLVLPAEPVRATTVAPSRRTTWRARAPRAACTSSTTIAGTPTGRAPARPGARLDHRRGEVVPVGALADEGDEEAAGLHLTGVPDDRRGHLDGRVRYVMHLPADDCGDLGEGEGDHKFIPGSSG